MQKIIIVLFTIGILVTQGNSNSPQVYNDIVVGEEYTVENYTLKGKTEECTLVFKINSKELLVTNCLELTNSKRVRIFLYTKKETVQNRK